MKIIAAVFLVGMITLGADLARADTLLGNTEVIIVGGDDTDQMNPFNVGSVFSFVSPTGTSPLGLPGGSPCVVGLINVPDCFFQNDGGFDWSSLSFSITPGGQSGPFFCLSLNSFADCSFSQDGKEVDFFGGPGIPNGGDFVVEVILWQPGTTFSGKSLRVLGPDATPEPGAMVLFLTGGVATLAVGRGFWISLTSRV